MTSDNDRSMGDSLTGYEVWLECPLCLWSSSVFVVGGAPNAAWTCYSKLGAEYRRHHTDTHRPPPRRMSLAPDNGGGVPECHTCGVALAPDELRLCRECWYAEMDAEDDYEDEVDPVENGGSSLGVDE